MPYITFTHYPDDGEAEEIRIPAHNVVCPQCNGTGRSSAYLGAFTQSDMDEQGPEFVEDYMRGNFDRICETCQGNKVIAEADEDRANPEDWKKYQQFLDDKYSYESERRMEMEAEFGPSYGW